MNIIPFMLLATLELGISGIVVRFIERKRENSDCRYICKKQEFKHLVGRNVCSSGFES